MKAMMFAVLTACLVITTSAVAAEDSDEGAAAGPKAITVDAAAQARFGVTLATLKGAAAPTDAAPAK